VAEFGFASATHELSDTIGKDFQRAEVLSVPITFVILLFAFGAFVAAGVPVLLAFTAVLASLGLSQLVSHVERRAGAARGRTGRRGGAGRLVGHPRGAGGGTRTHDPRFTRALLYQLSYSGPSDHGTRRCTRFGDGGITPASCTFYVLCV